MLKFGLSGCRCREEERGEGAKKQEWAASAAGKKPLMVIIDEDLIKAAKIAASRTDGMFQGSSRSCWRRGWRAGRRENERVDRAEWQPAVC
jgi:hypothetical protein